MRAVFRAGFDAVEIARLDRDHAADGRAAPDDRVGTAQHVDALDPAGGERAEIETARGGRDVFDADAIDKDEDLFGIRTAQAHAGEAAGATVASDGEAGDAFEHAGNVGALDRLDFLGGDDGDRLASLAQRGFAAGGNDGDRGRVSHIVRYHDVGRVLRRCGAGECEGGNGKEKLLHGDMLHGHERNCRSWREERWAIEDAPAACARFTPPGHGTTTIGRFPGSRVFVRCPPSQRRDRIRHQWLHWVTRSPVTVAGAAPDLNRLPS